MNNIFIDKKIYVLAPEKELVCVLPFIGKTSLQIRSKLVKSVQNNLSFFQLNGVFQSPYKLRILFGFKDTLEKKIRSDLVYRYSCSSWNATYYGKTYRHFFTRAAELMYISNLTVNMLKMLKSQQCNCTIDFDHFDILASDNDSFRLPF